VAHGFQPPAIEALEARVSVLAAKDYGTLAVAGGVQTGAPLGRVYDPPRPEAKQLMTELHNWRSGQVLTGRT
jgi:hypothetical protein